MVPVRGTTIAGPKTGRRLLIVQRRYFLCKFLQGAQHQALIGQRLFGSSVGLHRFWFPNDGSDWLTGSFPSRMKHGLHVLSHPNCRIEARRLLRLNMDDQLCVIQASRNASLATISVVLFGGPGYARTISFLISWARSVSVSPFFRSRIFNWDRLTSA